MKKFLAILIVGIMSITQVFAIPSQVIPIGRTAGIAVMYDGVLVAGLSQVETEQGFISPAELAGIETGDIIKEINGQKILSNDNIIEVISASNGEAMEIIFERDGENHTVKITPVLEKNEGSYKIGVWVRDSMAGIGTITYIDPETSVYGGLGHSIADSDTGELTAISEGTLIPSSVEDVIKGESGSAGELKASYNATVKVGTVEINTNQGIFGKTEDTYFEYTKAVDVADFSEVTTGKAYVLTNVQGEQVEAYEINILSINNQVDSDINFTVQITDSNLLEVTGGIVQGMSGSPILQNGKIIGAMTHVLVNEPTVGYAIYIGNMLETAEEIVS
ncbi:MAG: SpoIVB peptidase [Clostridia bacterium]